MSEIINGIQVQNDNPLTLSSNGSSYNLLLFAHLMVAIHHAAYCPIAMSCRSSRTDRVWAVNSHDSYTMDELQIGSSLKRHADLTIGSMVYGNH